MDAPSPTARIEQCPRCSGTDPKCELCDGTGKWTLYRCPGTYVDQETSEAIRAASFFRSTGMAPAAGGQLDQTPYFLEVVRMLEAETSRVEQQQLEDARRKAQSKSRR